MCQNIIPFLRNICISSFFKVEKIEQKKKTMENPPIPQSSIGQVEP